MRFDRKDYYENYYEKIVYTGSVGLVSRFIHKMLESNSRKDIELNRILEVGAGQGQHLDYVKKNFIEYFETDLEFDFLPTRINSEISKDSKLDSLEENSDSLDIAKVIQEEVSAENLLKYKDSYFDRVIATCLLVHLQNPEFALQEWRRVVADGGKISIYVPCEPGIMLRFSRHFTTVKKAKKLGKNHLSFHYREHVTYFSRLDLLIQENFLGDKVKRRFFPLFIPFWNFNLGVIYQIEIKK
jgi:SAM-dependent methyltransferase